MFMKKADRIAIYQVLFHSGVMFAERSPQMMHTDKELKHLTNLQVTKTMKSLKSSGYVTEQTAWRHHYWCLNNEGIEFLRAYLHQPAEAMPITLQRRTVPVRMPRTSDDPRFRDGPRDGKERDDRSTYRRSNPPTGRELDKTGNVGAGSANMEFRGGFGRGKKDY
ncbi:40S ribosomal protein S10b [Drosophila grimshawi]|uniref:GH11289 n=1 Tax=Drosophila grimshawi TaxID=7222 RepID=B4JE12_DROGR|nr:40S ribosomal protein S10b [Drosophila grimshawi]EDW03532.1 GH11289 [Drosophila grimshawi]